jgi:hypothetical protein
MGKVKVAQLDYLFTFYLTLPRPKWGVVFLSPYIWVMLAPVAGYAPTMLHI